MPAVRRNLPKGTDPVLHLLAGPNGSGKTTLVQRVIEPVTHLPFINADVIAAKRWPEAQAQHAYDASEAAAAERDVLLVQGTSFITETVFSHPSKLALIAKAQRAGYRVELHVVLLPEDTAVARVRHRVGAGGHDVPEVKIRERYQRLWHLVAQARVLADTTTFYDNSSAKTPLRLVARYEHGQPIGMPQWPSWTPGVLR
jgi:predicted ABC-type ATPase